MQVARSVIFFFLGKGRKCVWREKWASAMPPEVCAGRDTPGLRVWSCLMSWTQGSLDGKPPGPSPSGHRSGAAPASSLGVSLERVPEQEMCGTLLMEVLPLFSHLCPQLVLISGAETCVWQFKDQQECQIVPKSLKCSRIVRLSQSPWRAPAAWSWLTGTASCTTLSTLNSNSLSWTGLRSGVEKSWM